MRKGAVDVIEWPAERARPGATIELTLEASVEKELRLIELRAVRLRLAALEPGELYMLKMMLDGKVNKNIAIRLGIALRTVEARRKRVLEKMGTRSLSEIAGALNHAGLLGPSALSDAPTEADD